MKIRKGILSGVAFFVSLTMVISIFHTVSIAKTVNKITITCNNQKTIVCPVKKGNIKWKITKGKKKIKIIQTKGKHNRKVKVKGLKTGKCVLVARCGDKKYRYIIWIQEKASSSDASQGSQPEASFQPTVSPEAVRQDSIAEGYAGFYLTTVRMEVFNTYTYYIHWENNTSESITVKDSLKLYASSYLVSSGEGGQEYTLAPGSGLDMAITMPMHPEEHNPDSPAHLTKWTKLVMDEVTASDMSKIQTEIPYTLAIAPGSN